MQKPLKKRFQTGLFGMLAAVLMVLNLAGTSSMTAAIEETISLEALTKERQGLADELLHYKKTLALLHPDTSLAQVSENPAVRSLAAEMVRIRQRLIHVTEQEVTLLQEQIIVARGASAAASVTVSAQAMAEPSSETKPTPPLGRDYSMQQEARDVERLRDLLSEFYVDQQESMKVMPTAEEISRRQAAQEDTRQLELIPFNADKVRLNGSEGSTALSQITRRLSDSNIPESRRDTAPICSIKTRLFGSLIGSETRSMKPVGKHHYVARIRMQPGDTTLRILGHRWEISLPSDSSSAEYLFTLYAPPAATPELHVFAVDDLLAEDTPHIPAWLPDELGLKPRAG
ncbi:MAG: hypothetical protein V7696_19550 [Halioglobus sp.]